MTPAARVSAAIEVLDLILSGQAPEVALRGWAKRSRFAGSKDRAALRDLVFDGLRAKRSLAAFGSASTGRGIMLGLLRRQGDDPGEVFGAGGHAPEPLTEAEVAHLATQPTMSDSERLDIPDWLWPHWVDSLGIHAEASARMLQSRAEVFLRVNMRRCDRKAAMAALDEDLIPTQPHPTQQSALRVTGNARKINHSRAFLEGLVEVQDAASQIAVSALGIAPKAKVLDYCAGGGGKALAIADQFDVQVCAFDISPRRMADIPVRAARAGLKIDVLEQDALATQAPFDVVLCDAPCSGSGTWRRSPQAKWDLGPESLKTYEQTQLSVLEKAMGLVCAGGRLVYATCSVLRCENEDQVDRFIARNDNWTVENILRLNPTRDHDGFFLAEFRESKNNLR